MGFSDGEVSMQFPYLEVEMDFLHSLEGYEIAPTEEGLKFRPKTDYTIEDAIAGQKFGVQEPDALAEDLIKAIENENS